MEDATITTDQPKEQLYQHGRYPSVIDTDDLVMELGKQVVGNINNEKIIEQLITKAKQAEANANDAHDKQVFEENKHKSIEESNKLYEKNNKELSDEIVRLRGEIRTLKSEHINKVDELQRQIGTIKMDFKEEETTFKETIKALKKLKSKPKSLTKNKLKQVV
jgi:small-conductance mechanosensitive channel